MRQPVSGEGLPLPRRYWAVLAFSIGVAMGSINGNLANVALPTIGRQLHTDPATSIWIVNAFQLASGICVLPMSSLADIIGYKRVYRTGIALFTLSSILCTFSTSLEMLVVGRVLQGLATGTTSACTGPFMRNTYPFAALGRGIALNVLIYSVTSVIGPSLAAAVLSVASWHWLFAISIPFGACAFVLAGRYMPAAEGTRHRWDLQSALINAVAVSLLIIGIDGLGHGQAAASGRVSAMELAGALAFGVMLVRRQLALAVPMLAIDLFYRPIFALSALTLMMSVVSQNLAFVTVPFYLHDVLGFAPVKIGLVLTAWPILNGLTAQISGRLSDRYPVAVLGTIGMAVTAAGLFALALPPAAPSVFDLVWRLGLTGAGFGIFQPPNNRSILTSAPRERAGGAGAVQQMCRQVGAALGTALVAVMFGLSATAEVTAQTTGLAIGLAAVIALIGTGISGLRLVRVKPA